MILSKMSNYVLLCRRICPGQYFMLFHRRCKRVGTRSLYRSLVAGLGILSIGHYMYYSRCIPCYGLEARQNEKRYLLLTYLSIACCALTTRIIIHHVTHNLQK